MTTTSRLLIAVLFAGSLTSCVGADLSSGVRQGSIRAVELGMSPPEVIALLGEPKSREVADARLTFVFSAPVHRARQYPMLWAHFEDDRVVEVCGKRYIMFGIDDEGAYGLSDRGKWEARCFAETFPE